MIKWITYTPIIVQDGGSGAYEQEFPPTLNAGLSCVDELDFGIPYTVSDVRHLQGIKADVEQAIDDYITGIPVKFNVIVKTDAEATTLGATMRPASTVDLPDGNQIVITEFNTANYS